MANILSSAVRLYLAGYEIGTASTKVSLTLEVPALDVTAFLDKAESSLSGIRADSSEWSALFDDSTSTDAVIGTILGTLGEVLSLALGTAVGKRAYCGTVFASKAGVAAEVRGLVRIEGVFQPDATWDVCKSFGAPLVRTNAEYTGGSIDDGSATTGTGVLYGNCVFASGVNSTATAIYILRHSSDGTTFSNKATWSGITGTLGTRITFTGTLNRYIDISFSTADGTTGNVQSFIAYKRP